MEAFDCNAMKKSILDTVRVLVCISPRSFPPLQNHPQVMRTYGFIFFYYSDISETKSR